MHVRKIALLSSQIESWNLEIIKRCPLEKIFVPQEISNKLPPEISDLKITQFYKSDLDLFKQLENEKNSILLVFREMEWSIPLPLVSIRFIHRSQESDVNALSPTQFGNLLRRAEVIVTDIISKSFFDTAGKIDSSKLCQVPSLSNISPEFIEEQKKNILYKEHGCASTGKIKFHIVTPSYNHSHFIEKTINSVLNQKYPNFTYTIVDGASTDETIQILKKYENRVSWISEKDRGYADAVNKGLLNADADYYLWLPSDDMMFDENVLSRLADNITRTKADVIYSEAVYCDEAESTMDFYLTEEFNQERLREHCFICQPATAFSAKAFNSVGGLDIRFKSIADYDLWLKFSDLKLSFSRAGFVSARYRLQPDSITVSQRNLTYKEIFELELQKYGCVGPNWVIGAIHEIVSKRAAMANAGPPVNHSASRQNIIFKKISSKMKSLIKKLLFKYAPQEPVLQRALLFYLRRMN